MAVGWVRVKIDMNCWHLSVVVVLLGSLWQRVEADLDRRRLGATLGSAGLYEYVRILLRLCDWERVLSIGVQESRVVNAIVRI